MEPQQDRLQDAKATPSVLVLAGGILLVLLMVGVGVLGYMFYDATAQIEAQQKQMQEQENRIDSLSESNAELVAEKEALAEEIELLKNPPAPPYCSNGSIQSVGVYEFCHPGTWTANVAPNGVLFDLGDDGELAVRTSSSLLEDALGKYTGNVFTDTVDRDKTVAGSDAIEVIGTIKPDRKRAITVFTLGTTTFEVVLTNSADTSFLKNLEDYKSMVDSFREQ